MPCNSLLHNSHVPKQAISETAKTSIHALVTGIDNFVVSISGLTDNDMMNEKPVPAVNVVEYDKTAHYTPLPSAAYLTVIPGSLTVIYQVSRKVKGEKTNKVDPEKLSEPLLCD